MADLLKKVSDEIRRVNAIDAARGHIADLEACRSVLAKIMGDPRGGGIDPEHRREAYAALAAASQSDNR